MGRSILYVGFVKKWCDPSKKKSCLYPMLSASAYVPWKPHVLGDEYTPHPTDVCEPINLAATEQPALVYPLRSSGVGLSTLQTETIQRIMQSFASRRTFLLGDATGVGKGRTIAGLIAELLRSNEDPVRVAWVSASIRLQTDAENELRRVDFDRPFADVVMFTSYSAIQGAQCAQALVDWLGRSTFPLLVLDECHALRNHKSVSAQSIENAIQRLMQQKVHTRILYSSATACSQPRHMLYLGRLGLYGTKESPFHDSEQLLKAVRLHGTPLMELMAIDLRSRGAYVARQLSFANIAVSHHIISLSMSQKRVYDACGNAFRNAEVVRGSCHQSFFQRLITALKVEEAIRLTEQNIRDGASVVVSLINTGEASMRRRESLSSEFNINYPLLVGEDVLSSIDADSVEDLPENPLDRLINHFGPGRIAELSGRRSRYVKRGAVRVLEKNIHIQNQVDDFQSGRKHIAVLSRAGGVGISLDDATDGRRRVHIILEMPWSAEDLLQQMGRTHRSSSIQPPSYIMLTSDIPAELRFASSIVARLKSFGALVKGDRSSCCFSFLKVPRWSAEERRSIGLYLAVAGAIQSGDQKIPTITRHQALTACQCEEGGGGDSHVKTRITHMLQHADNLGPRRTTIIAAARRLFTNDINMLFERWTPTSHCTFPTAFKQQVLCMLMCHQAWETQYTLGTLSRDLVYYIVELMACPVSVDAARTASDRFKQHSLNDIGTLSMDMILNRMLGIELEVQRNIFRIADALVQPEAAQPSACLLYYVGERAGSCVDVTVVDISHASFDTGTRGVRVEVRYTVTRPPAPSEGARYWRHAKSGRTCWLDVKTHRLVFGDCSEIQLPTSKDITIMHARDYFECAGREWIVSAARFETNASKRISKLPVYFYLATVHALRQWDNSTQRVLRVAPTIQFPQGIIGLLMYAS